MLDPKTRPMRKLSNACGSRLGRAASVAMVAAWLALLLASGPQSTPEPPSQSLAQRIEPLIKAHKGKVAVAVKNLKTGESYAYHADEVMPTASLIKFPVMIEAYRQAAAGRIDLDSMITLRKADKVPGSGVLTDHFSEGATFPLRDAIRLMIRYSDNTATNLVLDAIGMGATAETMAKLGCPDTKIHSKVYRRSTSVFPERSKLYGLGSTTAAQMVRLYEELKAGRLVDPKASAIMYEHLTTCDDDEKFPRFLPEGTKIAFKTGSINASRTAAGNHRVRVRPDRALRADDRQRRPKLDRRQRREPALRQDRPRGLRPLSEPIPDASRSARGRQSAAEAPTGLGGRSQISRRRATITPKEAAQCDSSKRSRISLQQPPRRGR